MWPHRRIQDLFGIDVPIVQAPMAGLAFHELVSAVAEAGGLGSLPCGLLTPDQVRAEWLAIRSATSKPINLSFFCHASPALDDERAAMWRRRLDRYYVELGLAAGAPPTPPGRGTFDAAGCALVEELSPEIVSFHFGLPTEALVARVRATGAKIISSATTVDEARWLEDHGCDAIIAQGFEAGGHRGVFLSDDLTTQVGTMALVPQVVDAVKVPVIAAGGIADARGVVAAFALGASAVQIGTAFLLCPEARTAPAYRKALRASKDNVTALTNVFTGRPARAIANRLVREVGPLSDLAPPFPIASAAVLPLRTAAEAAGSSDFSPLWSGQAAALARELPAGDLTKLLASEAVRAFAALSGRATQ